MNLIIQGTAGDMVGLKVLFSFQYQMEKSDMYVYHWLKKVTVKNVSCSRKVCILSMHAQMDLNYKCPANFALQNGFNSTTKQGKRT